MRLRMSTLCWAVLLLVDCRDQPSQGATPSTEAGSAPADTFEAMAGLSSSFVLAIAGRRFTDAYGKLCPATRAGVSPAAFEAAVSANAYLRGATSVGKGLLRAAHNDRVTLYPILIESNVGAIGGEVHGSRESDGWCITGIMVRGTPALPMAAAASSAHVPAAPAAP